MTFLLLGWCTQQTWGPSLCIINIAGSKFVLMDSVFPIAFLSCISYLLLSRLRTFVEIGAFAKTDGFGPV